MRTRVRDIGNSKGVILPKSLLSKCYIEEEVTLEVKDNKIIISPAQTERRKGWADAFQRMAEEGDDQLMMPDVFGDENHDDWTWK
ncbi:MAG TPA: AbrB/MazE/SpoVT family DNA-binding domain-containing protein [Pedobacter sp.]|jgi:antitoxin MazE